QQITHHRPPLIFISVVTSTRRYRWRAKVQNAPTIPHSVLMLLRIDLPLLQYANPVAVTGYNDGSTNISAGCSADLKTASSRNTPVANSPPPQVKLTYQSLSIQRQRVADGTRLKGRRSCCNP